MPWSPTWAVSKRATATLFLQPLAQNVGKWAAIDRGHSKSVPEDSLPSITGLHFSDSMLALVVRAGVLFAAVVVPILIRVAIFVEHDRWSPAAGSADGKVAIVTGANSGLGLETARVLAAAGATVVAACRSAVKCKEAIADIRQSAPAANLIAMELDLANADSVRRFAAGRRAGFWRWYAK